VPRSRESQRIFGEIRKIPRLRREIARLRHRIAPDWSAAERTRAAPRSKPLRLVAALANGSVQDLGTHGVVETD